MKAESAATKATAANAQLRKQLYNAEMNMAYRAWNLGDFNQASRLLDNYNPKNNAGNIRRFEWFLLSKLCRPSCEVIHAREISPGVSRLKIMRLFPDRRTMAWGSSLGVLVICDVQTRKELAKVDAHRGDIYSIDVSRDGQFIVTAGEDGTVRVWQYPKCKLVRSLPGETKGLCKVSFSPDGSQAVVGRMDGTDGIVLIWNVQDGTETHVTREKGIIGDVAFSPDGQSLATAAYDSGAVKLWRVGKYDEPLEVYENVGRSSALCFSPDSKTLAVANDFGFEWIDLGSGQRTKPRDPAHRSRVWDVAFSPDGRTLATASADRTIKLWGVSNARILDTSRRGHDSFVRNLEFLDGHRRLISSGGDGTVRIWDLKGGGQEPAIGAHNGYIQAVAFAPGDQVFATAGDDGTVRTWNLASRSQDACFVGVNEFGRAHCVTYIPGHDILATGWDDGHIRLLDSNSLALIKDLRTHSIRRDYSRLL